MHQSTTRYTVSSTTLAKLNKKVDRLNGRAGCSGTCWVTVLDTYAVDFYTGGSRTRREVDAPRVPGPEHHGWPVRTEIFRDVSLGGAVPRVDGYRLAARIEHTKAGNIVSRAPGCEDIDLDRANVRHGDNTCDHCNTRRQRKDTFIVVGDDGSVKRIGRNCLADYLRSDDLDQAVMFWALADYVGAIALTEADMDAMQMETGSWGSAPRGACEFDTFSYVAACAASVRRHGWVSRSAARDSYTVEATASRALFLMLPLDKESTTEESEEHAAGQPTQDDFEAAAQALVWASGLADGSEYDHNLNVACALSTTSPKRTGLVASVICAFQRDAIRLDRATQARERAAKSASRPFGIVGERYQRELTVKFTRTIESEWGTSYLIVAEDADGNTVKTFRSCRLQMQEGTTEERDAQADDTLLVTFTVKCHEEYKGVDSTMVTRMASGGKGKWVGVDGRVFKTRKVMVGAGA
jgi:hypothetical protein